jgi:hypothetical protein
MARKSVSNRQNGEIAAVQRHVRDGADRINNQRQIIGGLRKDGVPTGQAEELLDALETTQRQHEGDLARMPRETPLQMAQRHVIEGTHHVERQREIIAELHAKGHPTDIAKQILETMLQTQASHEQDLARLTAEHEQT